MEILVKNGILHVNADIHSPSGVDGARSDVWRKIKDKEAELRQLAAATPKDLVSDVNAQGDPIDYVNERANEAFDELGELYEELGEINMIERVMDAWKYSDDESGAVKSLDAYDANVYDKLTFGDVKYPKLSLDDLSRSYDNADTKASLVEILDKANERFELNRRSMFTKYVMLYYKGELFITDRGVYAFADKETAMKHFYEKLSLDIPFFTNKTSVEANAEFIETVALLADGGRKDIIAALADQCMGKDVSGRLPDEYSADGKFGCFLKLSEILCECVKDLVAQDVKIVEVDNEQAN